MDRILRINSIYLIFCKLDLHLKFTIYKLLQELIINNTIFINSSFIPICYKSSLSFIDIIEGCLFFIFFQYFIRLLIIYNK